MDWRPTAPIENLRRRAEIIHRIRLFFAERNILEVDTPLLQPATVTDPHIQSISTDQGFLQTSPEYAMKRLLAAKCGDIFQICKAFRAEEQGRLHHHEFTLLEWYRIGFNHHALMDEVDALLQVILKTETAERLSYCQLFQKTFDIDPHHIDESILIALAEQQGLTGLEKMDKDDWLQLLLSTVIEPQLGHDRPTFIYDYPIKQAALARIRPDKPPVAERFEVYVKGVELANGFHELTNAEEQTTRFKKDNALRDQLGLAQISIDSRFIEALNQGLPNCAGVALGIDRLILLALGEKNIEAILSFRG